MAHKCITVRNITFGTKELAVPVCVSIMPKGKKELMEEAAGVMQLKPDMIEWRLDFYLEDFEHLGETTHELRKLIGNTVLIVTYRTQSEGGRGQVNDKNYQQIIWDLMMIGNDCIDFVDVELARQKGKVLSDMAELDPSITPLLIGSYHNFQQTPPDGEMRRILLSMKELGADIAKLAVMPESDEDTERLMQLTKQIDDKYGDELLLMTISMGEIGKRSRIESGKFGSCFTFAAAIDGGSAPGQIAVEELRKLQSELQNV